MAGGKLLDYLPKRWCHCVPSLCVSPSPCISPSLQQTHFLSKPFSVYLLIAMFYMMSEVAMVPILASTPNVSWQLQISIPHNHGFHISSLKFLRKSSCMTWAFFKCLHLTQGHLSRLWLHRFTHQQKLWWGKGINLRIQTGFLECVQSE